MSPKNPFPAEAMLLISALIWGTAFSAQRIGNEFMEPFTFNGLRFGLGSITLISVLWWRHKKR